MRRLAGLKRIIGLLVLGLSLHAVCPATDYNPRLELFNPSSVPGDVQRSTPATYPSGLAWSQGWAASCLRASLISPKLRKEQTVHAAIPIYQQAMLAADHLASVEVPYESCLYSSPSTPRASGRGPPNLIA
jgi:hypothetical protein